MLPLSELSIAWGSALALLVGVDAAVSLGWRPLAVLWMAGLALGVGAGLSVPAYAVLRVLRRLPRLMAGVLWLAAGAGLGWWLSEELGSFAKLDGAHAKIAWLSVMGAMALAPLVLVIGFCLMAAVEGSLSARPRNWAPRLALGFLGSMFTASVWLDRNVLVGLYPAAHELLGWLGMAVGLIAATIVAARYPNDRWRRSRAAATVALAVGAWLVPTVERQDLTGLADAPLASLVLGSLRDATDFDRDGFSGMFGGGDCAPFESRVHPAAREVPRNGRDDNCLLGDNLEAALPPPLQEAAVPSTPSPTSVVLITIDTLRADRMGLYGHARETTPRIDAWAKEATVFSRAFTSGGWTSIAISSMLYGTYPRRLHWTRLTETSRFRLLRAPIEDQLETKERIRAVFAMTIDEPRKPLAWWLQRRGMHTLAVVDDGHSEFLSPKFGLARGFDRYELVEGSPRNSREDTHTTELAIRVLEQAPEDRPFFLWVHYFGPHDPTTKHPGVPSFGKRVIDGYDHEVRAADLAVGKLLDYLASRREDRAIATILTADHGELITESGRQHGRLIADVVHVPLVVQADGWPTGVRADLASLVDIMPTVLRLTATPSPGDLDGLPLQDVIGGSVHRAAVLADTWSINRKGKVGRDMSTAIDTEYQLQLSRREAVWSLFRVDPRHDRSTNLLGEVERPELWDAINRYLELNSRIDLTD